MLRAARVGRNGTLLGKEAKDARATAHIFDPLFSLLTVLDMVIWLNKKQIADYKPALIATVAA